VRGIVLDTNVVSEPTRAHPSRAVRAWLERQDTAALFLTTTVLAEIAQGVERMPQGRKRREVESWLDDLVEIDFAGRILSFDIAAARLFGKLAASAYAQGRPPVVGDAQIAAVAARDGMAVATRDIAGFAAFGVPLIDPWQDAAEPEA
jgi:predicted nucleic acid-binding protein